ncbi:hypothetical protein [Candidatus Nitrospira bockiana]
MSVSVSAFRRLSRSRLLHSVAAGLVFLLLEAAPAIAAEEAPADGLWRYGAFTDLAYTLDFNFPQNHRFRNRSTTPRVNELNLVSFT